VEHGDGIGPPKAMICHQVPCLIFMPTINSPGDIKEPAKFAGSSFNSVGGSTRIATRLYTASIQQVQRRTIEKTIPPQFPIIGGYWQFLFLFWQFDGDVILRTHPFLLFVGNT